MIWIRRECSCFVTFNFFLDWLSKRVLVNKFLDHGNAIKLLSTTIFFLNKNYSNFLKLQHPQHDVMEYNVIQLNNSLLATFFETEKFSIFHQWNLFFYFSWVIVRMLNIKTQKMKRMKRLNHTHESKKLLSFMDDKIESK